MEIDTALRVVVLATTDPSDMYFANQMIKSLNVVGVVIENHLEPASKPSSIAGRISNIITKPSELPGRIESRLLQKRLAPYLDLAMQTRDTLFGVDGQGVHPGGDIPVHRTTGVQDINQPPNVQAIETMNPDVIVVCGCSILKKKIMGIAPKGTLNLHGGLSQRYRGTWPTYWSFHNKDPEYIGATVHFVSKGIDNGQIIYQARPLLSVDDNPESAYVKVVKLGSKMMVQAVKDIEKSEVKTHPLSTKGELYLSRMMTNKALLKIWKNYESGLLSDYLAVKDKRDAPVLPFLAETQFVEDL